MQRIRIRYTKEGRVRFVSARDLSAVWERALRRAELPIAYSEGFHPHPKVSFPDALPVGYASTGEYAELTFAVPLSVPARGHDLPLPAAESSDLPAQPGEALTRLSDTLPEGMTITTCLVVRDGAPKLARLLKATLWEVLLPTADADVAARRVQHLARQCDALLAADHAEVVRRRPDGDRTLDVRPAVLALHTALWPGDAGVTPLLRAVLRNDEPTIRPTDLYRALTHPPGSSDDSADGVEEPRLYRRVVQGEPADGGLREALSGEFVPLHPERLAGAA